MEDVRLSSKARFLLVLICGYLGKDCKACWASQARLAKLVGCEIKTLRRCIKELVQAGLLKVGKRGRSNTYEPIWPVEPLIDVRGIGGENHPTKESHGYQEGGGREKLEGKLAGLASKPITSTKIRRPAEPALV